MTDLLPDNFHAGRSKVKVGIRVRFRVKSRDKSHLVGFMAFFYTKIASQNTGTTRRTIHTKFRFFHTAVSYTRYAFMHALHTVGRRLQHRVSVETNDTNCRST